MRGYLPRNPRPFAPQRLTAQARGIRFGLAGKCAGWGKSSREEASMQTRSGERAPSWPDTFVPCAQCGSPIALADWSELVSDTRIRHLWHCHVCDYEFETL